MERHAPGSALVIGMKQENMRICVDGLGASEHRVVTKKKDHLAV